MSIYFPGGPADIDITEGVLFDEDFYFPDAVLMLGVAKRVGLEAELSSLASDRINLGTR
jgi:hypothetical protein